MGSTGTVYHLWHEVGAAHICHFVVPSLFKRATTGAGDHVAVSETITYRRNHFALWAVLSLNLC